MAARPAWSGRTLLRRSAISMSAFARMVSDALSQVESFGRASIYWIPSFHRLVSLKRFIELWLMTDWILAVDWTRIALISLISVLLYRVISSCPQTGALPPMCASDSIQDAFLAARPAWSGRTLLRRSAISMSAFARMVSDALSQVESFGRASIYWIPSFHRLVSLKRFIELWLMTDWILAVDWTRIADIATAVVMVVLVPAEY